jgi:GTP cyclohydrolase I
MPINDVVRMQQIIVHDLIAEVIGEDVYRPGLVETPARVVSAWAEWTIGYTQDPAGLLKTFEDGAEGVDEMVAVVDIPFYSHCEHHLAPFFGTATIAYIPQGQVVGLSKLSRLLDVFAKRLQVQERLTNQVVDALMLHLAPRGAACKVKARHLCMESRGVRQQGHHTVTTALRGAFKEQPETRAEFLSL